LKYPANTAVRIKCLFGGSHSGCKLQLQEPHFAIFPPRSAAMRRKKGFLRTLNLQFSLLKHHLQTSTNTKYFLLLLLVMLGWQGLPAQQRESLERQRQRLMEEIRETERELNDTKKTKAVTLDQYLALQAQIQKRRELIKTLKEEIEVATLAIDEAHQQLDLLNAELIRLKEEYARTIRKAYRLKLNNSFLLFLFSADSFDDAYRRWQYLRQYDSNRKRQAQDIIQTQESLTAESQQLEAQKTEKEKLLGSQEKQNQLLSQELKEKNKILKALNTSEGRLVAELDEQQQAHDELNNAIESIIQAEMAARARAGRANSGSTSSESSGSKAATPVVDTPTSNDFSRNQGQLPWPVKSGYITRKFGKQPHPQVRSIQITNNGIDIRSEEGAKVFPVFKGTVAGTQFIPGYLNTIIIKHGEYYTAYSNLEQIYVKRGDEVDHGKAIGQLGNKKPEVHFEVWQGKKRLNPSYWVAER